MVMEPQYFAEEVIGHPQSSAEGMTGFPGPIRSTANEQNGME